MKTIFEHIEQVKQQPHHVRKQVALAAAASCTALVALVWLVGSVSSGVFAIRDGATSATSASSEVADNQGLAGAGAAAAFQQSEVTPAHIEIIDAAPSASAQKKAEQTTIPF